MNIVDQLLAKQRHRIGIRQEVARLLPRARHLRRELSQEEVAAAAGTTQTIICAFETRGLKSSISLDVMERILQVYRELEKQDGTAGQDADTREESSVHDVT